MKGREQEELRALTDNQMGQQAKLPRIHKMYNLLDEKQNKQYLGQRIARVIAIESNEERHWVDERDQVTDQIPLEANNQRHASQKAQTRITASVATYN